MNFRQSDGTWTQIGITSFAASAGCQSGNPDGFTRIRSVLNWICSVTYGQAAGCGIFKPPPSCPIIIPGGYQCNCTATDCQLVPIPIPPVPKPQCPLVTPAGFVCKCDSSSCVLVPRPCCPPVIPPGSICICTNDSCDLFPSTKPTFPFFYPNINICICGGGDKGDSTYFNKL